MGEDAMIVAIVFGSILGMITIPMLINLAKKWVDRKNSSFDEEKFNRLAKAFISHKKDMERRVQNLEAIISDDEPKASSRASINPELEKKKQHQQIEIESNEESNKNPDQSGSGNLRNMLKE